MKIKHLIITLLVVGFGSLIVYRIIRNSGNKEGSKRGRTEGPAPAIPVNGVVVKPQHFANSLSVTGTIDPNEQVEIRSESSGLIRGIYFREGSRVQKGQTLLTIDDAELRAQLAQATTKEKLAAQNEKRAKLLLGKEAISQEEYDASLAELRSLQSQTQLVRAQIAKTVVRAPFSGKIGLRAVSVGEYLTPSTVVANLVSIDPLKITFSVPEKYAGDIQVNTALNFTVAGSSQKFSAKVYAIEPRIETNTRTLQLRAKASNPDGKLVPGQFANVELPLKTIPDAILVPTEAVIPVQEGKMVFIASNGKAKEAPVETSTRTQRAVLVTSGLKSGDTVLTTGVMSLKEGSPVKVRMEHKEEEK